MNVYTVKITSLTVNSTNAKTNGYWVGDALDTTGIVVTGHDASSNDYSIDLNSCTFSPTALNTAGESVTITVTYTNDDESTATGTYTVSVSVFNYVKATSINGGDKVIFATTSAYNKYMSGINASSYGEVTSYSTRPGTEHTYTVVAGVNDGSVAFKNSEGKYLNGSTAKALSLSDAISESTSWTVSFTDDIPTITNVASSSNVLKYNAQSPRIAAYNNSNAIYLNIYKLRGDSGQSAAESWASSFNTDVVNGVCKVNDPSTFSTSMGSAWSAKASTYAALSDEAKAYIASKTANASGDAVEKMLYEYNHIYGVYGSELNLVNFIGRTESVKAAARMTPINQNSLNSTNVMTFVIIAIVLTTTTGAIFLLRKKKEER